MPTRARSVPRIASFVPMGAAAEELALVRRLEELERGNPYQHSFHRFLTECVRTVDEAAGGHIAQFPDDPYNEEVCGYLIEKPLLFLEKARRVLMTWRVSALDLWVTAGGQDPRWPALMQSTGYRKVLIISKKEEDAAWVLNERVKFIYDQLVERGIHEKWPGFPTFKFPDSKVGTQAVASNGSTIKAVAQGEKQVRQFGGTLIHYEEVNHSPDARQTVAAALPVLMGKDGLGGHIVLVGTPNINSYGCDLRDGNL